jgi:replicative DNA helicase
MDLDAEGAVLSAILLESKACTRVLKTLAPEYFYSDANRRVFEACVQLTADSVPVDIQTVASWLRARGWINQIEGGVAYLARLADQTPSIANVSAYAKTVYDQWRLRRFISTCQRVTAEGYCNVGDVEEFLSSANTAIRHVCATGQDTPGRNIKAVMADVFRDLLSDEPDDVEGVYTGILPLDQANGVLKPGSVTTVLAYSSHGKSAFCACLVNFVSMHGAGRAWCAECGAKPPCPWRREYITNTPGPPDPRCDVCGGELRGTRAGIIVFSGEMRDKDYAKRMVQIRSGKSVREFKANRLLPEDRAFVIEVMRDVEAHADALWIDDRTVDVIEVRRIVAQKKIEMAEQGIELVAVVFDYAQRAKYGKKYNGPRREELAEIGRHLKTTAIQENVAMILPAQLNEEARKKGLKPNAENVREAQDLVMDSDNSIVIYAPCRDVSVDKEFTTRRAYTLADVEPVQFRLGKARDGGRGYVPGAFLPWITTFTHWDTAKYGEYRLPEEKPEEPERGHRRRH